MSTQITTQKILAFDEYADFGSLPGIEGYIYIDKAEAEAYLWDSSATPPVYVRIGADTPIPPDPTPLTFVDAATTGILSFLPNYSNGTLGVGATLTATQVGVLRDTSGTGRIDASYIPVVGGLVLVKNQALQYQNGIYVITTVGSPNPGGTFYQLTRFADFDQASELFPLQVNVLQGTVNVNQYFNQATPSPLVIGTSNLVFSPANYATAAGPIAFVDVATTTALPACTYANGTLNPSFPGLNATLTANSAGSVLTVDGLTASTSTTPLLTFTRVLVKDQANKAHNGDYIVVNPGSATASWQLRRINYSATGFYRFSRYFLVSNTQASLAGKIYITKQQNPALSNLGIGTQLIDLVEYGGSSLPIWIETNATDLTVWNNGKGNIATNTSFGDSALKINTTGYENTAIGVSTLPANTTGYANTSSGYLSLNSNTTGHTNTAFGTKALQFNTIGLSNTAVGYTALQLLNNGSGSYNIALGYAAGQYSTSANGSIFIGYAAGQNSNANGSIFIGYTAATNGGNHTIAMGYNSGGNAFSVGIQNISLGWNSGAGMTTGNTNTHIGIRPTGIASGITTGVKNVLIGGDSVVGNVSNTAVLSDNDGNIAIRKDANHFVGVGYAGTDALGSKFDVKAQGALSTDLALRVRNNANTSNLFVVKGTGVLNVANMPTSPTGLVTGDIWNNLGILTII